MKTCNYIVAFLAIVTVACIATPALAQVTYWGLGTGLPTTDHDWNNAANWSAGVPALAGHVIIGPAASPHMPIITTSEQVGIFSPTWNGGTSHSGIIGGSLNATSFTRLASLANTHHRMSIDNGGNLTTPTLQMSMVPGPDVATARINLNSAGGVNGSTMTITGGIGYAYPDSGALPAVPGNGNQSYKNAGQNIDLEVGSTLLVAGDRVGNGEADWWANGWNTGNPENGMLLSAVDGTGVVEMVYNFGTGFTEITASDPYTKLWGADFEDGEVNPGYLPAGSSSPTSINTEPYPAAQPASFADSASAIPQTPPATATDGYGWTNRGSGYVDGQTIVVDTESYTGENSASVENRTLRTDIPLTLEEGKYRFTFWYMVPDGQDLSFMNKIVMKDQTNGHLFLDTTNADIITAPAHDVWFSRTEVIDTNDYGPAVAGDTVQFRFGAWFQDDPGDLVYTDNWSLSVIPEPASAFLLGFGGLALVLGLRRRR